MDDLFKNTPYKILELFIDNPSEEYSLRGIARAIGVSHSTVLRFIADFENKKFLIKKKGLYPVWKANFESDELNFYKKNHVLFSINNSGLISFISNKLLPSSIVLFGSMAKGTYNETSDIDLFVECVESKLDISRFESGLNRKINIIFEESVNNLSDELRNNIVNGITLYGFLKVKDGNEL